MNMMARRARAQRLHLAPATSDAAESEQELVKAELVRSRDFLQQTLDSLRASLAVLDEAGEIIATNLAWRQFAHDNGGDPARCCANYPAACDLAVGDELAARAAAGIREILARPGAEFSLEYPCHSDSGERWFVMRATPYLGAGDAKLVMNHTEVTQRRVAQAQITTQAALLDEIDVAVVATDLGGRITHWNRGAEHLYGWLRGDALGEQADELIVRSDGADQSRMAAERHRLGYRQGEFEIGRKDGSTLPAFVRDRVIRSDAGLPDGVVSVSVDMSERIAAERARRAAGDYLRAVMDSVGEGLYTADLDGRVTYMNDAAEHILGWRFAELEGRVMHDVVHSRRPDGSLLPRRESPILRSLRDGGTVHVEDEVFVSRDRRLIPIEYTVSPFDTEAGWRAASSPLKM